MNDYDKIWKSIGNGVTAALFAILGVGVMIGIGIAMAIGVLMGVYGQ